MPKLTLDNAEAIHCTVPFKERSMLCHISTKSPMPPINAVKSVDIQNASGQVKMTPQTLIQRFDFTPGTVCTIIGQEVGLEPGEWLQSTYPKAISCRLGGMPTPKIPAIEPEPIRPPTPPAPTPPTFAPPPAVKILPSGFLVPPEEQYDRTPLGEDTLRINGSNLHAIMDGSIPPHFQPIAEKLLDIATIELAEQKIYRQANPEDIDPELVEEYLISIGKSPVTRRLFKTFFFKEPTLDSLRFEAHEITMELMGEVEPEIEWLGFLHPALKKKGVD